MRPAYKYCLMSFLVTLPITIPFAIEGMYYESRLDLYVEICFQRIFNGIRPIYCNFYPSSVPRAITSVIVMASVFSILLMPVAFPIAFGATRLRLWWIARRDGDKSAPGSGAPPVAPNV